jgi:O-antigen biosynthesis protein
MARVSCLVSAYYAEEYLEGRLQNLLAQKPRPEIVVICQMDSAEHKIATPYSDRDEITIVVTHDIPTVYAAWNLGIQTATGDFLTNSNCDDRLYPSALAKLSAALDNHPKYAVAYADVDIVKELGGAPDGRYEWAEGSIAELLTGCFVGPMPMWRKSLHDKYGLFDAEMQSAGDYEFWMRIAKQGERFFHVREVCGAYLKRDDSAEHRFKLRSIWEQARAKGRYREGVNELWTKPGLMTD